MTVAGDVVTAAAWLDVGQGFCVGVGLGVGADVGLEVGVGVEPGVEPLACEGVAVGVAPGGGVVTPGVAGGVAFATGVGAASATPETTRSGACAGQEFFQQIFTMCSPSAISLGTVISSATLPMASAWN